MVVAQLDLIGAMDAWSEIDDVGIVRIGDVALGGIDEDEEGMEPPVIFEGESAGLVDIYEDRAVLGSLRFDPKGFWTDR